MARIVDIPGEPAGARPPDRPPPVELDCNGVPALFSFIARGAFLMGSPPDEPHRCPGYWSHDETRHEVVITAGFWMGFTVVTQAQWRAVMGYNTYDDPARGSPRGENGRWIIDYPGDIGPDKPVVGISRRDALDFCDALSAATGRAVRLPTEARWEYACRAGSTTAPEGRWSRIMRGGCSVNVLIPLHRQQIGHIHLRGPQRQTHENVLKVLVDINSIKGLRTNKLDRSAHSHESDLGCATEQNRSNSRAIRRILRGRASPKAAVDVMQNVQVICAQTLSLQVVIIE